MAVVDGRWRQFVASAVRDPDGFSVVGDRHGRVEGLHSRDGAILYALRYHVAELLQGLRHRSGMSDPAESLGVTLLLPAYGWSSPDRVEGGQFLGLPLSVVAGLNWPMAGWELRHG